MERIKTAHEVAKHLIRAYVLRGDEIAYIRRSWMCLSAGPIAAQIGGYKVPASKIIVTRVENKEIREIFSLSEIYNEILAEQDQKNQLALF